MDISGPILFWIFKIVAPGTPSTSKDKLSSSLVLAWPNASQISKQVSKLKVSLALEGSKLWNLRKCHKWILQLCLFSALLKSWEDTSSLISGFLASSTFQIQHVQSPLSHSLMLDIQKSKILRLMPPHKEKPNHCSHHRLTATEQFGLQIMFRFEYTSQLHKNESLGPAWKEENSANSRNNSHGQSETNFITWN